MSHPETNAHFKIKTRQRHDTQYPQRNPHDQGHDLPPIPMRGRQYPPQGDNDAPHIPLWQGRQRPQQYPNPDYPEHFQSQGDNDAHHMAPPRQGQYPQHEDQEMHQVPSRQGRQSNLHSQENPRFHDGSPEHIPQFQDEKRPKYSQPDHHRQGTHPHLMHQKPQGPRVPSPRKTKPLAWFLAICCTVFWVLVILGGLIVLIIYLIYHPESPHFQISTFTLNTLYLDSGNFLNADIRILANFNNSNRKVSVDFSYLTIDLYYGETRIGTQYIEPFYESNSVSTFADIHMVTSQLHLPFRDVQRLAAQVQNNRIQFVVKGTFRTRSNLGSWMHYSYWLDAQCTVVVTSPPAGILLWKKCRTKRL
uniref:Late embryogenesis abundant protein LEA-2 subgroup domain-containing protein n=1 Tax=Kalanchoe fedtschenkoi TaxID=63787 RepID=A0A7N0UXB7_KALFE